MTQRNDRYCDLRDRNRRWWKWVQLSPLICFGVLLGLLLLPEASGLVEFTRRALIFLIAVGGIPAFFVFHVKALGYFQFPHILCEACGEPAARFDFTPYFYDTCLECGNDNRVIESEPVA